MQKRTLRSCVRARAICLAGGSYTCEFVLYPGSFVEHTPDLGLHMGTVSFVGFQMSPFVCPWKVSWVAIRHSMVSSRDLCVGLHVFLLFAAHLRLESHQWALPNRGWALSPTSGRYLTGVGA